MKRADSIHFMPSSRRPSSARAVILTALAAVLAFIPLTLSVFWGAMAYTLIGGTAIGTVLTLVFLPALYAIWFRVRPGAPQEQLEIRHDETGEDLPVSRVVMFQKG
jgi:fatty acid desaturase